ncbi:MAG TPA: hypothetical protein VFX65_11360 [Candidatus Limnocylindrales bacterium]|nr:hypothetical protein [Candidatus Limnocylindrales bacterium]
MTVRIRWRSEADVARTWAETLGSLAQEHRTRRTATEATRWPLAHRCSGSPEPGSRDPGAPGRARRPAPFCCRALA